MVSKTLPTTPLQIFSKTNVKSKVIVKSVENADDNF